MKSLKAIIPALLISCLLEGKDFGTKGHVFPIVEESVSDLFSRKSKESFPEITKKMEATRAVLEKKAKNPSPVTSVSEAEEFRSFHFEPIYVVEEDIRDSEGNLIAKAGEQFNPLERFPLSSYLLFFNGENEEHIKWAKQQTGNFKWILVQGSPIFLEEREKRPVYFDQQGKYTSHFNILHVPARVIQDGTRLLIEEIPIKEGLAEELSQKDIPSEENEFISSAIKQAEGILLDSETEEHQEKKCNMLEGIGEDSISGQEGLYILISFSVPIESWKDLSLELERANGVFILNGLPDNSFTELVKKVSELNQQGIRADVQVDPNLFQKYAVEHVPAIVLDNGNDFDKVIGNISLSVALKLFEEKGSNLAKEILANLSR